MTIPTEPIGSIPRQPKLIEALLATDGNDPALDALNDEAIEYTISRFEAMAPPVISDGEPTSTTPSCFPCSSSCRRPNFYIALGGEKERARVLKTIREYMKQEQNVFVGVIATINPKIETPEEVTDRILEAAEYIPMDQLGITDDCGYTLFSDVLSTTRDTASAKIHARIPGTRLAAAAIGGA